MSVSVRAANFVYTALLIHQKGRLAVINFYSFTFFAVFFFTTRWPVLAFAAFLPSSLSFPPLSHYLFPTPSPSHLFRSLPHSLSLCLSRRADRNRCSGSCRQCASFRRYAPTVSFVCRGIDVSRCNCQIHGCRWKTRRRLTDSAYRDINVIICSDAWVGSSEISLDK